MKFLKIFLYISILLKMEAVEIYPLVNETKTSEVGKISSIDFMIENSNPYPVTILTKIDQTENFKQLFAAKSHLIEPFEKKIVTIFFKTSDQVVAGYHDILFQFQCNEYIKPIAVQIDVAKLRLCFLIQKQVQLFKVLDDFSAKTLSFLELPISC